MDVQGGRAVCGNKLFARLQLQAESPTTSGSRTALYRAVPGGCSRSAAATPALALKELPEVFDNAIDSRLFHVFSEDDRRRYVEGLASVLKPGGRLLLLCFSTDEPGTHGPRRVARQEILDAFAR